MPISSLAVVPGPAFRRSVRATVIGLVLVVSAGTGVPSALAVEPAGADVQQAPDFTVGDLLSVRLAAAPVPTDLDLSGARFEVLDSSGAVVGWCDTAGDGTCDIPTAGLAGAPATYRLVQDAGSPVPGLVPSSSASTFTVGSRDPAVGSLPDPRTVTDASLFRSGLAVAVQDAGTRAPVPGAEYSLTGPDYRHSGATPQEAEATSFPDNALSGSDGRLTFSGWFLPGDWSLTPEVTPRGYRSSGVLPLTLPAPTGDSADPWSTVVGLAADVPDMGTGAGGPPVPSASPQAPGPGSTPAARPTVAVPPDGASPDAVAPAAQSDPSAASTPAAAPASTGPSPAPAAADDPALPPVAGDPAAAAGSAPLRVTAGTSSLDLGLIGFVALLVELVVFGVGYLRRRARH